MTVLPTVRESLLAAAGELDASPHAAGRPEPSPARSRRRVPCRRLALAGAAAGAIALLATAFTPAARTVSRTQLSSASTREMAAAIGTGSVSGTGVWRAAREIARATPYPPARVASLAWVRPIAFSGTPVARAGLAARVQWDAVCLWYRYWLDDPGRPEPASTVVQQIPTWPTVRAGALATAALTAAAGARNHHPAAVRAVLAVDC